MKQYICKLVAKQDLTPQEAEDAMSIVMSGGATDAQIGSFLTALSMKGETITEIAAFAKSMRKLCTKVELSPDLHNKLVDTCGTGGDVSGTFNVSTAAAIVAAGAGIPVAKHGNRRVSSKSGSADVLEKLGVKIELHPKGVRECIEKTGIGFMFAPNFHSAMKNVANARKDLGIRTVFNILGPLVSPAEVRRQVYGIYDVELTPRIASVLKEMGSVHAMVVHGAGGLDEISNLGKTRISELKNGKISTYYIEPKEFGLKTAKKSDLVGMGPDENAEIIMRILKGEKGPKRDIVVMNAGAAIYVGDRAKDLKEGIAKAQQSIDSGAALDKLQQLIKVSNAV